MRQAGHSQKTQALMPPASSPRRVNGAVALLRSGRPWRQVPSGDRPEWLATTALAAARAGSEPELAKCLEMIGTGAGGPGFPAMILMWTDMLIDATGPAERDDLAKLDDAIYATGYDPAHRWANLLAAARATGDDRACEALLAALPHDQAAGYAHTYVTLVAAAFNGIADAIRAAAEQGDPGAQEWAALMQGQGERQDVQIVMHARHQGRDVQVLGVRPADYAMICIAYDDTGEHAHIPAGEVKSADDYSTNAAAGT
jgi:hypothetical protein